MSVRSVFKTFLLTDLLLGLWLTVRTLFRKKFTVNYLIENSTGMLLTAWILSNAEAAQKRAGSDSVQRNFTFESDATPAR